MTKHLVVMRGKVSNISQLFQELSWPETDLTSVYTLETDLSFNISVDTTIYALLGSEIMVH